VECDDGGGGAASMWLRLPPFASAGAAELFGGDKHGQERGHQR
jgi:hypothetical protein